MIRLRRVPVIDSTGLAALRDVVLQSRKEGTLVVLSDVHSHPVIAVTGSALMDELGEANICGNIDDALNRARISLGLPTEERPRSPSPRGTRNPTWRAARATPPVAPTAWADEGGFIPTSTRLHKPSPTLAAGRWSEPARRQRDGDVRRRSLVWPAAKSPTTR